MATWAMSIGVALDLVCEMTIEGFKQPQPDEGSVARGRTMAKPCAPPVQLSFASLTVLMFGWPLAVWTWLVAGTLLLGRWLIVMGDAFATGMLTSIFVALRTEWLATYSDRRYLRAALGATGQHDRQGFDQRVRLPRIPLLRCRTWPAQQREFRAVNMGLCPVRAARTST